MVALTIWLGCGPLTPQIMNSQPIGGGETPVDISQRIVLNFYTAKRLLHALHVSVQRHEEVFGKIETDINKRVVLNRKRISV